MAGNTYYKNALQKFIGFLVFGFLSIIATIVNAVIGGEGIMTTLSLLMYVMTGIALFLAYVSFVAGMAYNRGNSPEKYFVIAVICAFVPIPFFFLLPIIILLFKGNNRRPGCPGQSNKKF